MAADESKPEEVAIPPRVRRLWGLDAPTRKGPRPGLSRDEIVEAAVKIADEEGLTAVSMSRVASALGYTTMSLYRYVESKDELVTMMWDHSLAGPTDFDYSQGWRASLEQWAFIQLRNLRKHPWALDIPINTPPISPRQLHWMEVGLATLKETPLPYAEKLGVILAVTVAVMAEARLTRELAEGDPLSMNDYGTLITQLAERDTYPHLRAAVDEGVFAFESDDPDEDFAFSLGLTLDGIEKLIHERSA